MALHESAATVISNTVYAVIQNAEKDAASAAAYLPVGWHLTWAVRDTVYLRVHRPAHEVGDRLSHIIGTTLAKTI